MAVQKSCAECDISFIDAGNGRPRTYCSKLCGNRAYAKNNPGGAAERNRRYREKNGGSAPKRYSKTCQFCSKEFLSERKGDNGGRLKYCSTKCRDLCRPSQEPWNKGVFLPRAERSCEQCGATHVTKNKTCGRQCNREYMAAKRQSLRSPLRAAIEDWDCAAMINTLVESVDLRQYPDINGQCWIWRRASKKKSGEQTYPVGPNGIALHRSVCEVAHGGRLGGRAAHHKCAVTMCVNPLHLVPVTNAENAAEMLARSAYIARISELEDELRSLDPDNLLLDRIAYTA